MKNISDDNKIEFYKFLNNEKSVEDLESFIYSQTDLEKQLNKEVYLELITLNFKDKYEISKLTNLIKNGIISEGEFETWKLKRTLNDFLSQPENIDINLDRIYHLYCGVYQDNQQRKYEYKFLGNLGLNYLYWIDEGYLKTHYGNNWEIEYEKCKKEFGFYHEQLKNFATEILLAIDSKNIEVLDDGTYRISTILKNKLETDKIYKLKHSN